MCVCSAKTVCTHASKIKLGVKVKEDEALIASRLANHATAYLPSSAKVVTACWS